MAIFWFHHVSLGFNDHINISFTFMRCPHSISFTAFVSSQVTNISVGTKQIKWLNCEISWLWAHSVGHINDFDVHREICSVWRRNMMIQMHTSDVGGLMLLSCTLWFYCGVGSTLPTFRVDNFDVFARAYTSRNKVLQWHVHLILKKLCRKFQHHVQLRQSSQKIWLLLKVSHSLQ